MAKKPHRKGTRPPDRPGGPKQKSEHRGAQGGGGGAFVDRSGKAHTIGRRGPAPESAARPTPHPARRQEHVHVERPDSEKLRFRAPKSGKFEHRDRDAGGKEAQRSGAPKKFGIKKFEKESARRFEGKLEKKSDHRSDREHGRGRDSGRGGRRDPPHPTGGGRPDRGGRSGRPERDGRREAKHYEAGIHKGTVDKNRKGFGFLIFEKRGMEDAFIPPREAERLFHGDRVEVRLSSRGDIESLRVIEHRFREVVGRYTPHPTGRGGWVIYERKRAREEIYIPDSTEHKIKPGDWIRVKLEFHEKGQHAVTGEVKEVYGQELPPSADVGMIAAEFNLIEEHSATSEAEAKAQRLEIPGKDLEGRDDLRSVPFITIDGETARDFDDAVYVERSKSGYVLWVAIADVSHYVIEGSALDKDAQSRGTSVYFPERAFHMLPRALSENLCSLKPDEPRLAMVAKMFFDRHGKVQKHETELMEAVIQSKRRATYNQIQAEWEENKKNKDWEFHPQFELFHALKKMRQERGSIDFDLPESELIVKPTGEVVSIKERARLDAHRLIEEFMIAANEAVTEWIMARHWPFVYRVHEEPAADSLERFQKLAATVGVRFSIDEAESPLVMAELVRRLEGHPAQAMLNMALLRSLKQAVYSSTHGIHYGLASNAYTHFTSPIRRYPDLVVHRLLRRALRTEKGVLKALTQGGRDKLEEDLMNICEHCSYRERLASDAERESIRLKQVRAMIPELGNEFDAKVMGMIETGLFAQVKDPYCEGMINKESMTDDFYVFNEERMVFYGQRKKRTFKVGDPVRIRVLRADIDRRQIDFGLLDGSDGEKPEKPFHSPRDSRRTGKN